MVPGTEGFEVSWRDAGGEHRRPLAEATAVEFEAGLPVRGFPSYRGQQNFPGLYWSATTGGHVGFESWLERDHAMLLDFTPEVIGLLSQPLWLFWRNEKGRVVSHAPDYFARFEDGRGLLVDCRPLDRVDGRSAAKFAVTQLACESAGWGYQVVGVVDAIRMANVRWLAGYARRVPPELKSTRPRPCCPTEQMGPSQLALKQAHHCADPLGRPASNPSQQN